MDPELARIIGTDTAIPAFDVLDAEPTDRESTYRKTLYSVAELLGTKLEAESASVFCSGFSVGAFQLVASWPGRPPESTGPPTPFTIRSTDKNFPAIQHLLEKDPFLVSSNDSQRLLDLSPNGRELTCWLYGRGEFFGFMSFDRSLPLNSAGLAYLRNYLERILAFLSDENFAYRLNLLLNRVNTSNRGSMDQDAFFKSISDMTARGFGADGAIVRTIDSDQLVVRAASGELTAKLTKARALGEGISGRVFEHADGWAAVQLDSPNYDRGTVKASKESRQELRDLGIRAIVICRISTFAGNGSGESNSGTLCYFFARPHLFSRRDLDLFRAHCRRVSDYLEIIHSLLDERDRNVLLDAQTRRLTYVEVANLLAHDLWHKSFNTSSAAKANLENLKAAISKNKLRAKEGILEELIENAESVQRTASEIYSTSDKLRAIQTGSRDEVYKSSQFTLEEVLDVVEGTLAPALSRSRITVVRSGPSGVGIFGPRVLFEQVIFNLIINSIDAARQRTKTRAMTITLNWHTNNNRLVVRYRDDGPGIDQIVFPDANEIFKAGRTSKPNGSGTGLPVARQLIGSHFGGNLRLDERQPVLFTFDIALRQGPSQ